MGFEALIFVTELYKPFYTRRYLKLQKVKFNKFESQQVSCKAILNIFIEINNDDAIESLH